MTSAPGIGFEAAPSRWLARATWLMTTLAVAAVALSGLAWVLKLALVLSIGAFAWRERRFSLAPTVRTLAWSSDGRWTMHRIDGDDVPVALRSHRVIGTWVWLRFGVPESRPFAILLASDNSDEDLRRRLRMRLAVESAPDDG